ncbi:MAG TPA: hypothetical protein VFG55_06470, partial [Rhodanobacteraceae bacterium]|nr:hypothetical protein [Rhodanobacteraceae bacterium]
MVALVLITSAAIGALIYRNVEAFAIPRALARIDLNVRVLATILDGALGGVPTDVKTQGRGVRGLVAAHIAGGVHPLDGTSEAAWRKRIASRFVAELKAKPAYMQYRLVGLADGGREIVRVDRRGLGGAIRIAPDAELRTVGDRKDFKAAMALPPGRTYVSPITFASAAPAVDAAQIPLLEVAAPVFADDGTPFGFLAIAVDLRPAFMAVRASAPVDAPVYLVGEYGRY